MFQVRHALRERLILKYILTVVATSNIHRKRPVERRSFETELEKNNRGEFRLSSLI